MVLLALNSRAVEMNSSSYTQSGNTIQQHKLFASHLQFAYLQTAGRKMPHQHAVRGQCHRLLSSGENDGAFAGRQIRVFSCDIVGVVTPYRSVTDTEVGMDCRIRGDIFV